MPRAKANISPTTNSEPPNSETRTDRGYGEPMDGKMCPMFRTKCKGAKCTHWFEDKNHANGGVCVDVETAFSTNHAINHLRELRAVLEEINTAACDSADIRNSLEALVEQGQKS